MHVRAPDQAGQALEPSVLIPLQLLGREGRTVLVGDPQQLPATVLSRPAERAGLGLSLFERLQQVPMVPAVAVLPEAENPKETKPPVARLEHALLLLHQHGGFLCLLCLHGAGPGHSTQPLAQHSAPVPGL